MSPLQNLMETNPVPTWRNIAWPIMILLAVLLIWANFAELDEVAVANGQIVPLGDIKVIQHLEGGIVEQIFVQEGDTIKQGEPLLMLDLATAGVNKRELEARLDGLFLNRARLQAEAEGIDLELPDELTERRPTQAGAARQTHQARKDQLQSKINVLQEQVRQKELEVDELTTRRSSVQKNLKLARERFKMSTSLLSEGLTAKIEHLELEAEVESLEGESETLGPTIDRAKAAVEETRQRIEEERVKFRREAKEQLGEIESEIAQLRERLDEATEQGFRAEIKSPIDGVVKNMRYNTIGGVVRPGEPILEIVPLGGKLVVEGKLNPTDRGFVEKSQRAIVKISTYDFARYGGLEGEVVQVAPDSSTDEAGNPFFRLIVQTDKTYLGRSEGELPITPGMQATIDVHTGKKSVMTYLIKPVLKLKDEAFRER